MVEEAVATVEEVVGIVVVAAISVGAAAISLVAAAISLVAAAISLGSPGIVLPAIASQNIKERTLRGTEIISETEIISGTGIISGTTVISFLEMPLRMITHTTGSTIRTTAIMTTMLATIPMGNPHQSK